MLGGQVRSTDSKGIAYYQEKLNKVLKLNPPLVVDGIMGPKTRFAIRQFQEQYGLVVDGLLGPQTIRILTQGVTKADSNWVAFYQKKLNRLMNLNPPLVVDGIMGEKTVAAIREFQKQHGLIADGIIGVDTKRAFSVYDPLRTMKVNTEETEAQKMTEKIRNVSIEIWGKFRESLDIASYTIEFIDIIKDSKIVKEFEKNLKKPYLNNIRKANGEYIIFSKMINGLSEYEKLCIILIEEEKKRHNPNVRNIVKLSKAQKFFEQEKLAAMLGKVLAKEVIVKNQKNVNYIKVNFNSIKNFEKCLGPLEQIMTIFDISLIIKEFKECWEAFKKGSKDNGWKRLLKGCVRVLHFLISGVLIGISIVKVSVELGLAPETFGSTTLAALIDLVATMVLCWFISWLFEQVYNAIDNMKFSEQWVTRVV